MLCKHFHVTHSFRICLNYNKNVGRVTHMDMHVVIVSSTCPALPTYYTLHLQQCIYILSLRFDVFGGLITPAFFYILSLSLPDHQVAL